MRLIDADAIPYFGEVYGSHDRVTFKMRIDALPTVDAVEVVRCGDCKHRLESGYCKMCRHCDGSMRYVTEDEFCSMGIQKEVSE